MLHWNEIAPKGKATGCVITLHGRGTNGTDLIPIAEALGLTELLWVFPDAPFHFDGLPGGLMWFGAQAEKAAGIRTSRKDLFELIDHIATTKNMPTNKIALVGFSQGAVMSLDVGLRYEKRLATIVALSGFLSEPQNLAEEKASASKGLPVFLGHGTDDEVVKPSGSREAKQVLLQAGHPVTLHEFSIGHTISLDEIALVRTHLQTHLINP